MNRYQRLASSILIFAVTLAGCDGGSGVQNGGTGGAGTGGQGATPGTGGTGGMSFGGFTVVPPPPDGEFAEKESFEPKKTALLDSAHVPSALAGAFFQLSRAYLSGREPKNDLEADAFAILDGTGEEVRDALARTLDAIDAMDPEERIRLYDDELISAAADVELTTRDLAIAVSTELTERAMLGASETDLGIAACLESAGAERAGSPRVVSCFDVDRNFDGFCNSICRVKTPSLPRPIRTVQFRPPLSGSDYLPIETEQECAIDAGGVVSCELQTPSECTGTALPNACLAVPVVRPGETVIFQGFNFFDTDAAVSLFNLDNRNVYETEAFVCGDVETPNDVPVDCEISDVLSFSIPPDAAPGRYAVSVIVPNNTGSDEFTRSTYGTNLGAPILQVLPPPNTVFQLRSEELLSIDETSELFSDELGLKIITVGIQADGTFGELESIDFEFGNLDEGNRRRMDRTHFTGAAGDGFGISIVGFEIDNREAFEKTITDFADAFVEVSKSNWGKISATAGTVVGGVVSLVASPAVGSAVGAALTFAINAVVALWAPADLVIEDFSGISFLYVSQLTGLNFPNPPAEERTTENGIEVLVEPCEDSAEVDRPACEASAKGPNQYRERREYRSDKQGSTFQITLRYNRLN